MFGWAVRYWTEFRVSCMWADPSSYVHRAVSYDDKSLIDYLISCKASLDILNSDGEKAIISKFQEKNYDMVKFLLERGATFTPSDKEAVSVFHTYVKTGELEGLNILLSLRFTPDMQDSKGIAPLYKAISANQIEAAKLLLAHNANPFFIDANNKTLLHKAAETGSEQLIELLILKGVRAYTVDNSGLQPIHYALKNGHINAAGYLESNGSALDFRNYETATLLHSASAKAQLDVMHFLIERGAPVNYPDSDKYPPLYYAVKYLKQGSNHADAVSILLRNKADIRFHDSEGNTLVHLSVKSHDVTKDLIERGAPYNTMNKFGEKPLFLALKACAYDTAKYLFAFDKLDFSQSQNASLLIDCIGDVKILDLMMKNGAKVALNVADSKGLTALYHSLFKLEIPYSKSLMSYGATLNKNDVRIMELAHHAAKKGGDKAVQVVEILAKNKVSLNHKDSSHKTAFEHAIEGDHFDIAYALKKHGAKIVWDTENMKDIFVDHTRGLNTDIVKKLVKDFGADIHTQDKRGHTAVWYAIKDKHDSMLKCIMEELKFNPAKAEANLFTLAIESNNLFAAKTLMSHKALVNQIDYKTGHTPLTYAIVKGATDIAKALIVERGTNLDLKDVKGNAPIHHAVLKGNKDVLDALLVYKADLKAKNAEGKTISDIIISSGDKYFKDHKDIVELLAKYDLNIKAYFDLKNNPIPSENPELKVPAFNPEPQKKDASGSKVPAYNPDAFNANGTPKLYPVLNDLVPSAPPVEDEPLNVTPSAPLHSDFSIPMFNPELLAQNGPSAPPADD